MRRNLSRGRIQPKISTMPRQQSEAAAFLDIYKLVIEKKRLQQELHSMDERRQQILDRLSVLDQHVTILEDTAHQMRDAPVQTPSVRPSVRDRPPAKPKTLKPRVAHRSDESPTLEEFNTLFLEY